MQLPKKETSRFDHVASYVEETGRQIDSTAGAFFVIQHDQVVTERYWGYHAERSDARKVQADSRFNVASVRKSYLGLAVAWALYEGKIGSIDDNVSKYLPEIDADVLAGTTIRHLLTHTHGLGTGADGKLCRRFAPGTSWEYRGENNLLLTAIIERTTGKSAADRLRNEVFAPLGFVETDWQTEAQDNMVMLNHGADKPADYVLGTNRNGGDNQYNLYVSARELAYWGYLHLKRGKIGDQQIVPEHMFDWTTTLQSPVGDDRDAPQNGFYWFVKELPAKRTEIGEQVPRGSYQMLGYSGAALLVIPSAELVAVRMYNRWGSPAGYDYLQDIRHFGDLVAVAAQDNLPR